jgi:ubiquinone/menaquinone biosynthesis C-methylase UbiE
MTAEFDEYASSYSRLLRDPVRDRFAGDPSFFNRRKWEVIRDFLARNQLDSAQMSWLDVGCGQGQLLNMGGKYFGRAAGCDPSREMITRCTSAEVHEQSSPFELPFPDESFDFVTAACVFHHVHGHDRILLSDSIRRVLKPHGVFCNIEHNPRNPVTRLIVRRCPIDRDAELLNAQLASQLMRSAGLEVLGSIYFLYCPKSVFPVFGGIESLLRNFPLGGQYAVFGGKKPGRI